MDPREKEEERNKRIGWLTSVAVQLIMLVIFYFIVAWREPFPPIPEYGIELGFTTSSGAPASADQATESNQNEEIQQDQVSEESTVEEESREAEAQEQISESTDEDVIEEYQDEVLPAESEVNESDTNTEVEDTDESESEETQEVDSRAVMKPSETDSEQENENTSKGEEKEIDQRAIYGSQGTNTGESEGANLSLAGWVWDFKPKPDDESDAAGKIVYKITVDDNGELRKIVTELSTVPPEVERKYRQAVEQLSFSKTAEYKTAQFSTGTITFIIKSK